ncbi:hypothetical protein DK419_13840 [Methylobacterium terrae]|uniref:RiboL-PSP-HEPN domain-containing protein n=1 Tax=Methylobacterium terrae TaxID=2202827 RepID=A0A2U8WPQ1_9HYPH|nr:hypothetical protein [Methylobacterium terrae]AWN47266.1 hypothetical protein DK419_13840 [Methylobacterium terrae]
MSIFRELADQYAIADGAFAALESRAFARDDDGAYDVAVRQREHNDRSYFLYVFTRFETTVNEAVERLLSIRCATVTPWPERRVWETLRRSKLADVAFLIRVQLLLDKSQVDYAYIRRLYESRNGIGHGGDWTRPYDVADVAARLETIAGTVHVT